ncbi:MAG: cytochrome c biogenesis protein ResB [Blautia sp.]|nr:cytochrome c biogenesis protein ResB [Blautia sp.]
MKKTFHFFFSMKFAIGILIVLAAACIVGSVIPQGETMLWYAQTYSERMAGAVMLFGLNDIFHSLWFVILTIILCLNLLGCNLVHLPSLWKRTRNFMDPSYIPEVPAEPIGRMEGEEKVHALFSTLHFRKIHKFSEEGIRQAGQSETIYSLRNLCGIWGAWLTHLGMLIIIAGFALGQMTKSEETVYGVPGQTKAFEEGRYELAIDDFETILREDDTVEQYTASLSVTDTKTGQSGSGEASVNHPLSLFGYKLYQNSTGYAATLHVEKAGEEIQTTLLCAGEYTVVEDLPDLVITLAAFYPDYVPDASGKPMTASPRMDNPAYLYRLYYQERVLGMNVLTGDEVITVEDYTFRFSDPQQYTLIQIKRDPFTWLAGLGGLIILLALLLAFYVRMEELWAVPDSDGSWKIYARSRKGGAEYLERVKERCKDSADAHQT